MVLFLFAPPVLFSQFIEKEDPAELMSIDIRDSNVSLELSGTWKGTLQGNIGAIYSPLGLAFSSPESPVLFRQEADLTLSLWINKKWFVEANIQDEYTQNTYRAGFRGGPGDIVKYAGIGNTGLDFPAFPYLDLGGNSPSSFGFYSRLGNDSFDFHALARYDAASREERYFSGTRERTISHVQPQNYSRGVSFVLPDQNITSEITVYLEDPNGVLPDENNRRWRLALHSEYAAGRAEGLVELAVQPAGMVAVVYDGASSVPGAFVAQVKQWFSDAGVDLDDYTWCVKMLRIGNADALVIYEPGTFSPFERQNRYDAPSGNSEQAHVIWLSKDSIRTDYELIALMDSAASGELPLNTASVSLRNIYELLPAGAGASLNRRRSPQNMWPLAKEYPQIYLPARSVYTGDTVLRFINYSGNSGYFIGSDVVEGSVQVWRSGIQDSNFIFSAGSGHVILHTPAAQNEIVRITFLKRSEEARIGSIAAGLGAMYRKPASPFSIMGAAGVRWNLTESSAFTEEGNPSIGTIGGSVKADWEYDFLKAHVAAGFAYEKTDTTGLYRAAGMEGHQVILPLAADYSFLSNRPASKNITFPVNRTDLIYRNYYDNGVLGSTLMPITWPGAAVIPGMNKPYPAKDPMLGDNHNLVADFVLDFDRWTGFQVPTGSDADFISCAQEVLIPFRLYGFNSTPPPGLRLVFQIGALSPHDVPFNENPDLIWEREMDFAGANMVDEYGRHITRYSLTDEDRKLLANAAFFRLIVINQNPFNETLAGRVILAPPIFHGSAFRPLDKRVMVSETIETEQPFLESRFPDIVRRLHPGGSAQRVLKIEWDQVIDGGASAGVDGRTGDIPLGNFKSISFFFKAPKNDLSANKDEKIRFVIAPGPESVNMPYLSAEIPLNEFKSGDWSKVTIRYQGGSGVSINGVICPAASMQYNPARAGSRDAKINYIAFFIDPGASGSLEASITSPAAVYIDEIILEDPNAVYRVNAGTAVEYAKPGDLLSIRGVSVISDLRVSNALESEIRLNENNDGSGVEGSVVNRSSLEAHLLGARVSANVSITALHNDFLWSADHGISRSIGDFSFKESFFASPGDKNAGHNLVLSYLSNFFTTFNADVFYEMERLRQTWRFDIGYNPKNELFPMIALNSGFSWLKNKSFNQNDNYAQLWAYSWAPLVPDAGTGANTREARTQITITQRTRPVGAVLAMEGLTNFTAINDITRMENSLFLDIPLVFPRINLNFRLGRRFLRQLHYSGNDVVNDGRRFFESIADMMPLWGFFPIYSLFAPGLDGAMDRTINNSSSKDSAFYTAYTDHFSARMSLPGRQDFFAFLIPSRAMLRLERMMDQKMDTRSDILNLSASIGFNAVNMFGSMGYKPVFKFYVNDEFDYSLQTVFVFNNKEDVSWRLQPVISMGFRTANTGIINLTNTLTLRNKGYWTESFTFSWTTPAQRTLINWIYRNISGFIARQSTSTWPGLASLLSTEYQHLRKETIELLFDKTDYLRWNIAVGHEAIIRVPGRLEFTGFAKLRFGQDSYRETFNMDILLGTTLQVNF